MELNTVTKLNTECANLNAEEAIEEYQVLTTVNPDRIQKPVIINEKIGVIYAYEKGDRVKLLDHDDFGIVYEEMNQFYMVPVYYTGEFIEVNVKRMTLEGKPQDLYPAGYDLTTLFSDYHTRKMALRAIDKEIRKNRK